MLSTHRFVTGLFLGAAALCIGTYLLLTGDPAGWSLTGVGALCLVVVLAIRHLGQRVERGGVLDRPPPKVQRTARVLLGLLVIGVGVAVQITGDASEGAVLGLPRWLFSGACLLAGVTLLGWAALGRTTRTP